MCYNGSIKNYIKKRETAIEVQNFDSGFFILKEIVCKNRRKGKD